MENLAPLIFFALIGLIQLLVRWVRTIQQQQQQQQQQRQPGPLPEKAMPPVELPLPPTFPPMPRPAPPVLVDTRALADEEILVRMPARPASGVPPQRAARRRGHARLGSRSDVRRAIVLMEILGPPRAATDLDARGGR